MKFLALAAIATSTLAVASAADNTTVADLLNFSAPIGSTVWNSNSTDSVQSKAIISWTNDCAGLANTTLPVVLNMQQNGLQVELTQYGTIGYIDCAQAGSATLASIPKVDVSSNLYSILVRNGNLSYSALFTIINPASPNIVSNTTTTTVSTLLPTSTVASTTTVTSATSTTSATPTTKASGAGAMKVGSTAALVVLAAAGLMF
ncbi:hypothetical protein BGZ58_007917 [Dissophora ornata]|nr:hypothetical protein BGZ58_007917 [Dissophora ornata]